MNILDFYSDIDMKTPVLSPPVGVASLTGAAADLTTWLSIGQYTYDTGFYRKIYRKNINASSGIVLGGTGAIATIFSPYNWVTGSTPKMTDGNFRNAFFINVHNKGTEVSPNYRGIYLQIDGTQYQGSDGYWHFLPYIRIGNYRADPTNAITDKQDRTNHKYYNGTGYEFEAEVSSSWTSTSQYNQIAMYSCVVNETDYFLFVLGVNNGALHTSNTVPAVLIPRSYFKYNIPKPYVGPVSKDSAEGFTPPTGADGDSIGSRDLTGKLNPYGFNTGNGLILANLGYADYCDIVKQIYTGISGNPIDGLSQIVSGAVGGNSHRPADELNTMISAVLCCHVIPEIGTGATGGTHSMKTLAGYKLYDGSGKSITTTTQTILSAESGHYQISPVVNNFLLFEPFCSFSLSLPFVGDIQIPPSLIWTLTANHEAIGNYLYFVERLDMFTGVFSVDVHIINAITGKDILYTTRQTNCAVDLPVMGTGATGNPLQKIASAAGNIASGFAGIPAGAGEMLNAFGALHSGSVCGRVGSPNLAAYVATRERYAVITWADSAAPENYFDVAGGVRHGAGTVGSYRGYTEFENVDLSGLHGATDAEKQEIERILTGGVFL